MFAVAQECGTEQRHDDSVEEPHRTAAVRFGNEGERTTRFKHSEDLSDVGGQVGPVVVRLCPPLCDSDSLPGRRACRATHWASEPAGTPKPPTTLAVLVGVS